MSYAIRFTVCTHNMWAETRWPERQEALKRFLELHTPDIYCVQELRPVTRKLIDVTLANHQRVEDPFAGWLQEGNIYWTRDLFELVEYGAEDIGLLEELRRLFWVRLRIADGRTLFVSTAHYTWPGNALEKEGGLNPRRSQASRTVEALSRLVPPSEPLLFMGDLNDFLYPLLILHEGGLTNSFLGLGRNPEPTHPVVPTTRGMPQTIDWILHRGPIQPMTSEAVDFFAGDIAPSDHKPVLATYRMSN